MKKFAIAIGNFYDEGTKLFIIDEVDNYLALKKAILLYDQQHEDYPDSYQKELAAQASISYPSSYDELAEMLHNQGAYFINVVEINIDTEIKVAKIEVLAETSREFALLKADLRRLIDIVFPNDDAKEIKHTIQCLNDLHRANELFKSLEP